MLVEQRKLALDIRVYQRLLRHGKVRNVNLGLTGPARTRKNRPLSHCLFAVSSSQGTQMRL